MNYLVAGWFTKTLQSFKADALSHTIIKYSYYKFLKKQLCLLEKFYKKMLQTRVKMTLRVHCFLKEKSTNTKTSKKFSSLQKSLYNSSYKLRCRTHLMVRTFFCNTLISSIYLLPVIARKTHILFYQKLHIYSKPGLKISFKQVEVCFLRLSKLPLPVLVLSLLYFFYLFCTKTVSVSVPPSVVT